MSVIKYNKDMTITRYTTPTIEIDLEDGATINGIQAFSFIVKQRGQIRAERTASKIAKGSTENSVIVKLTSSETASLNTTERPQTQVRYRRSNGDEYATEIFEFDVLDVLKDSTI